MCKFFTILINEKSFFFRRAAYNIAVNNYLHVITYLYVIIDIWLIKTIMFVSTEKNFLIDD